MNRIQFTSRNYFIKKRLPLPGYSPFLLTILLLFAATLNLAQTNAGSKEKRGPYKAGYKRIEFNDYTRIFNNKPREIKLSVWYPLQNSVKTGECLSVEDYMLYNSSKRSRLDADSSEYEQFRTYMKNKLGNDYNGKIWDATIKKSAGAFKNAPAANGRFPLIIYTHGNPGNTFENYELCELLARNGFIVISMSGMGTYSSFVENDLNSIEAEARDIENVIEQGRKIFKNKTEGVFLIGFSWGGLTNVITAMRNEIVDGLITLDGAATMKNYFPLLQKHFDYRIEKYNKPTLMFTSGKAGYNSDALFNDLVYADRQLINVLPFSHTRFLSMENLISGKTNKHCVNQYEPLIERTYNKVTGCILSFLKHYSSPSQKNTLFQPALDEELFQTSIMKSAKMLPLNEEFIKYIQNNGIDAASAFYNKVKSETPGIKLFEESIMNSYGYHCINYNKFTEAVKALTLLVAEYPASANAFDSLGDAYMAAGKREPAIENYEKSLKLDPSNKPLAEKIRKLKNN